MLLSTVMIVSREIFEAAILVSLLMSFTFIRKVPWQWIVGGISLGLMGSWVFAINLNFISTLWSYRGQEFVVSTIYLSIFALLILLALAFLKDRPLKEPRKEPKITSRLGLLCSVLIGLALVRELGEIIVYWLSFSGSQNSARPLVLGAITGLSIGSSMGVVLFFILIRIQTRTALKVIRLWLSVISGILVMKAATLLSQINVLPDTPPLWDSSFVLREGSLLGHLASALIGYESHPTLIQIVGFLAGIGLFLAASHGKIQANWKV